jgi:hypothetical protein
VVSDPCRTASIEAVSLTSMTVVLGETENQYYLEATDSAGDSYGTAVCGTRDYRVMDISANAEATVVTVQASDDPLYQWKLVATSQDEADEGFHNLRLEVTFTDYPLDTDPNYPYIDTIFTLQVD